VNNPLTDALLKALANISGDIPCAVVVTIAVLLILRRVLRDPNRPANGRDAK
jgi:hypothetical protein